MPKTTLHRAYHSLRYREVTARAISVRLDDEADKDLRTLEAAGMSQSYAIRIALVDAVRRLRRSEELANLRFGATKKELTTSRRPIDKAVPHQLGDGLHLGARRCWPP